MYTMSEADGMVVWWWPSAVVLVVGADIKGAACICTSAQCAHLCLLMLSPCLVRG